MFAYLPAAVYLLCFATSALCAIMLGGSYRRSGASLLFWSSCCFVLLAMGNLVLVFDLLVIQSVDLRIPRILLSLAAISTLLFGFIWNGED
ncbi:DUF5985 family protein [Sphingomonas sp. SRS2]|uniref:DUF5985 family protein n=1 Tax=Sphingomonas sp. SRS2 TaxID=133190 RepID=UPI0006183E89|nr:DUF5985 family protein [Sphingomonas sp. SRS2]KKC25752.1 membrane protein [Sphingomonas sp. SRS2]